MDYRRHPDPPYCPVEVKELERYIASLYPTPDVLDISSELYDIVTGYLDAYDKFTVEMGWVHRGTPFPRIPIMHGMTGPCYIRRAKA